MSEVTRILSALEQGDPHAAEQLLPLVYEELRQLATQKLAHEKPGQTLQATALVHEAYLRLVDVEQAQHWNSRGHFFAAAAQAMRRILIDQARRKAAEKAGGKRQRVDLAAIDPAIPGPQLDLLALDEALTQLAKTDPRAAAVVNLRFFGGPGSGSTAGNAGRMRITLTSTASRSVPIAGTSPPGALIAASWSGTWMPARGAASRGTRIRSPSWLSVRTAGIWPRPARTGPYGCGT
jgi:RNA polymerase sigma factor (TIGR02999 family)